MRQATCKIKANPRADEAIHCAIEAAILHGRLPPGLRLREHRLAAIFGVSRERIRKVLHRLAAERRLEIVPNRGARVPCPSEAEVRAIYEAHRVLEAGVLAQLSRLASPVLLDRLDTHLVEERAAAQRGDRAASIRLSGDFHRHLVDALGNAELSRMLRDLLGRSSVMVTVYEPAHHSPCAVDEHGTIVAALRAGDLAGALHASRHHFLHVEERLRLIPPAQEATVDLEAALLTR
ncbi:GntR family transcriptional regulator [Muricoccus pecuniae]|uniref:DNA-binding GntR family transcriptional regulator n=1 Tax=Muricoccus pecuniae TaxID=693023 RepID=A0A840Y3N6_9PROT|nr:GntR family transcriptional regulator [Roseomonas pecuniae]MBB5695748.1 DNA-binding GntR family transcriptional regulator [Roseomonas pecuniae]